MSVKVLGHREIEHDHFSNYRQHYRGPRRTNHTWKARLEAFARLFGQRPAVIQGDRILTWDRLNRNCNRLAHGMETLGIKKEDRVAILGFNSIEWIEVYFAASKIGAVPTNVNPRFVLEEVHYVLEDSDAVIAFVEEPYAEVVAEIWPRLPGLKNVVVYGVGKQPSIVPKRMLACEDVLSNDETNPETKVYNDDFCFLMYTGGTTGYPKGTVWDGEQRVRGLDYMLINNLIPIIDRLAEYPDETVHGISTLFFSNPKLVKIMDELLASNLAREVLRTSIAKDLLFLLFKMIVGNPYILKVVEIMQSEGIRFLCAAPLFHGAGYEGAFTYLGGIASTTVFLPTPHPFDAREFWETIERYKVHTAVIVGDAFALPMVEELRRAKAEGRYYDLKSLWAIVSSGARWSPHLKRELLDYKPGLLLVDAMGASESSGAFASVTSGVDETIQSAGARVLVGKGDFYSRQLFPAKVIDPETGKEVKPGSGEIGEFVFGGHMALGYWKCPKKTANDFRIIDGKRWFFVGDEGTVSEDGRFNLIGRGGNYVINTGGEKVYSEEVEEIIKSHPKIRDVAVIGVPDPRWGQAVAALVELEPGNIATEEEIVEWCRNRMAGYKRPRRVYFVDKIPRSAIGKIERARVYNLIAEKNPTSFSAPEGRIP
ncbi:AMP-binding protein [Candidatus Solincola tengchongensis]|uniref:AMP-binding protein n=1 Tax=Candidatus Solincola tengchongensis TaxID=2900693 RepID=UPI0025800B4C|nr:AMP-binding protein [Candidatus Solincola tengchongensis]